MSEQSPIYSSLAGDEELGEIIVLFAAEMPERAARFQRELAANNREGLRIAAHQLKGSAGSHGFAVISRAAAELDSLIKNDASDAEIAAATATVVDLCIRATSAVEP